MRGPFSSAVLSLCGGREWDRGRGGYSLEICVCRGVFIGEMCVCGGVLIGEVSGGRGRSVMSREFRLNDVS